MVFGLWSDVPLKRSVQLREEVSTTLADGLGLVAPCPEKLRFIIY